MIVASHHPQFLPYAGFFARLLVADLVLLDNAVYPTRNRENFRARNKVRSQRGWIWVSVPTRVKKRRSQIFSEVEIDNTQRQWQRNVFGRLEHNYARAAYFKKYRDLLADTLMARTWIRLIDLNMYLLSWTIEELGLDADRIKLASALGIDGKGVERVITMCRRLSTPDYLAGPMEITRFTSGEVAQVQDAGITLHEFRFSCPAYKQCWSGFVSNLSILDMLFNLGGPRSRELLERGIMAQ